MTYIQTSAQRCYKFTSTPSRTVQDTLSLPCICTGNAVYIGRLTACNKTPSTALHLQQGYRAVMFHRSSSRLRYRQTGPRAAAAQTNCTIDRMQSETDCSTDRVQQVHTAAQTDRGTHLKLPWGRRGRWRTPTPWTR